jgi:alanine racemase
MSYIIINKSNLINNLEIINKRVGDISKIATVLKDNAYGHGIIEIAKIVSEYGIKTAVVRNIKEAIEIEHLFDEVISLSSEESQVDNISSTINSISDINKNYKSVHIKVDTGMHRNGININDLNNTLDILHNNRVKIKGIFSHIRGGDELSSTLFWQEKNFFIAQEIVKRFCNEKSIELPRFHLFNSSSLFRKNSNYFDFVRVGIAIYGYLEMDSFFDKPKLKPVLSLVANKISNRIVEKSQKIGYNGQYTAKNRMNLSTYDVGYGDGLFRNGATLPNGCEILGRVSMDNISINSEDEEITVFDDADYIAKLNNTISYDVLVKLNPNIQRVVF